MSIQIFWKFHHQKLKVSDKNSDIFHISALNVNCGYSLELPRRCGSNEDPQSIFLSKNKKNNVYPCKPQFYHLKAGFKGVKIILVCFRDEPFKIHVYSFLFFTKKKKTKQKKNKKKKKKKKNKEKKKKKKTLLRAGEKESVPC